MKKTSQEDTKMKNQKIIYKQNNKDNKQKSQRFSMCDKHIERTPKFNQQRQLMWSWIRNNGL